MEKITNQTKPNFNAIPEVALPTKIYGIDPSEAVPHSEAGVNHFALRKGIDDRSLNSLSFKISGEVVDATDQLKTPKVKLPRLTNSQRREALLVKLKARGEVFDPVKWRRGKRKKTNRQVKEAPGPILGHNAAEEQLKRPREAMDTSPSAEAPTKKTKGIPMDTSDTPVPSTSIKDSYKNTESVTNIAIFPIEYPKALLSADHAKAIENAILDELLLFKEDFAPIFEGTFMENCALIVSCASEATVKWLEELILRIKPLGEQNPLRTGLHEDILRYKSVFFRAHPRLLTKTPEDVIEMLHFQNRALNIKEWMVLPPTQDPKGYGFICVLDEVCFNAVKAANHRAYLGLWQISLSSSIPKDDAEDMDDEDALKSPTQ